ncbi:SDR family oxidoreductase [Sphingobium sp. Sx8-8]|uniref:SDR family NAD(P)-dependent oxidoreductase n=1 Tax=Sphingobium sp. Sx8-8 TaxID=2933617 RepID=UPI001F580AB7|nr:SDR family oxidoreductase [Sphingobium sp. Sx8-8]
MARPVAFITGASRGIGKAIALSLAEAGYDLILSARTVAPGEAHDHSLTVHKTDARPLPGSLQETAAEVEARGARSLLVPMDLTDRASVGAAAQKIIDNGAAVDMIVHNGRHIGPGLMDLFLDIPVDAYAKFFEAHGIAPIILTRALLPGMLQRGGGTVITITSSAAYETPPAPAGKGGWGMGYAVGKAAGHQLVGTLHAEYFGRGLRAYNVQPGFIGTERNHIVASDLGHELSRAAPPSIIGALVKWLVTEAEAETLSGSTIEAQDFIRERGIAPGWVA